VFSLKEDEALKTVHRRQFLELIRS